MSFTSVLGRLVRKGLRKALRRNKMFYNMNI